MDRFIVFSDLHFNLWNYGSSLINGRNSRLIDQQNVIKQIHKYASDNDINTIFFCGDFFHKHSKIDAEVLKATYESLELLKRDTLHHQSTHQNRTLLFLVGNHDMSNKDGSIHSLDLLRQYGTVIDKPLAVQFGSRKVFCHPYTEDKEQLSKFLNCVIEGSIVLLHQGISGVPVNSTGFTLNETLSLDMIPKNSLVFSGHYHSFCKVSDNVYIPGSPLQLTQADRYEKRGWLDVSINEFKNPCVKLIESVAPKFLELNCFLLEGSNLENNFIRVLATENSDISSIREYVMSRGARSVEVVIVKEEDVKEINETNFSTVEELFNDFVESKKLDKELVSVGRQIMEGTYCASIGN